MPECSFCEHENPPHATRCGRCSAWLVPSVDAPAAAPPAANDPPGLDSAGAVEVVTRSSAFGMTTDEFQAVLRSLAAGDKVGAIKQLREATGLGLAEAKQAAEALERLGAALDPSRSPPEGVEVQRGGDVTTIVRRGVLVGDAIPPEAHERFMQMAVRRAQNRGCALRLGVVVLALLNSLAGGLIFLTR